MSMRTWYALPCAGIVALAASGCAGNRQASAGNPAASRVATSQRESEKALESARKAQERASEQQKRAAQAQADVKEAQRRLTEAQARAEQEAQKANQAQQQANEATREATQQAAASQQSAAKQLAAQQALVSRGEQIVSGQVQRSSPSQLVVRPQNGEPMTIQITPQTKVQIDGRAASAADIGQGEDARVAYEMTGTQPTAVRVQVVTGNPPGTGASGTGGGTATPPNP